MSINAKHVELTISVFGQQVFKHGSRFTSFHVKQQLFGERKLFSCTKLQEKLPKNGLWCIYLNHIYSAYSGIEFKADGEMDGSLKLLFDKYLGKFFLLVHVIQGFY